MGRIFAGIPHTAGRCPAGESLGASWRAKSLQVSFQLSSWAAPQLSAAFKMAAQRAGAHSRTEPGPGQQRVNLVEIAALQLSPASQ
jgi:hypothetical protein